MPPTIKRPSKATAAQIAKRNTIAESFNIPPELADLMGIPVPPKDLPNDRHAFNRESKWDQVVAYIKTNNPYPRWTPIKNAPKAGSSTTVYLKNRFGKPYTRPASGDRKSPASRTLNKHYVPGFEAMTIQGQCYFRINPSHTDEKE